MNIGIVTPAPPRSRYGNRVTALRWARLLGSLGHRVTLATSYENARWDLLVALHARRSREAVRAFRRERPAQPIVVALTGTDLYGDLPGSAAARESLELATRIVVLQPKAREQLEPRLQPKTRVIYQSAASTGAHRAKRSRAFDVCVIGHLRPVKDPFRAALAARTLDAGSRIRILHLGGAMSTDMAARARAEMRANARYHWLGEQPAWRTHLILARSRLLVLSSRMEGGANALSEAIVSGVPVLASRIPGSVGILGEDYPGYFEVGDTRGLACLLQRAEADTEFLEALRCRITALADLFDPERERTAWKALLKELREPAAAHRKRGSRGAHRISAPPRGVKPWRRGATLKSTVARG
jgi:putative glycosyltransferase (TIGR04348 family)